MSQHLCTEHDSIFPKATRATRDPLNSILNMCHIFLCQTICSIFAWPEVMHKCRLRAGVFHVLVKAWHAIRHVQPTVNTAPFDIV